MHRTSFGSLEAKRIEIRPRYVSLIEVKHETKLTSMTRYLNMSLTSFTPDFLETKNFLIRIKQYYIKFVLSTIERRVFFLLTIKCRSSFPEVFYKKVVFKTSLNSHKKHLPWRVLFNKVPGLRPATLLLKKRL